MITDDELERCLKYLAESSKDYSEARGRSVWLSEMRKITKSKLFLEARKGQGTVADCEAQAYANPEYERVSRELGEAEAAELLYRSYREAAASKVEAWRSLNANRRGNV